MADLNPTMSIMTLNTNCLSTPSKKQIVKQNKSRNKMPTFHVKNRQVNSNRLRKKSTKTPTRRALTKLTWHKILWFLSGVGAQLKKPGRNEGQQETHLRSCLLLRMRRTLLLSLQDPEYLTRPGSCQGLKWPLPLSTVLPWPWCPPTLLSVWVRDNPGAYLA